ncbi:hypothetical protein DFP72DRAFT_1058538 [Ephemerocybe angulata]|uniref:Uncharacterized protein n=1 Tax=Ephemerocybe angulata TaxID=980116 RepID=A0A8H6MH57_9AGAR|nr:hypothetical protein DFP72DRAFT_1058538 [Tulosesus angulatus]
MSLSPKSMHHIYAGYFISEDAVLKWLLAPRSGDKLPRWRHSRYLKESDSEVLQEIWGKNPKDDDPNQRRMGQTAIFRSCIWKFECNLTRMREVVPATIIYNDKEWKFAFISLYEQKEWAYDVLVTRWKEDHKKVVSNLEQVVEDLELAPFLENPENPLQFMQEGADGIETIIG